MTAEIFFSKDKKITSKKQIQETYVILLVFQLYIVKYYFVQLNSIKPVFGTLIQYLLDGDTFNLRIQCFLSEVLLAYNL